MIGRFGERKDAREDVADAGRYALTVDKVGGGNGTGLRPGFYLNAAGVTDSYWGVGSNGVFNQMVVSNSGLPNSSSNQPICAPVRVIYINNFPRN